MVGPFLLKIQEVGFWGVFFNNRKARSKKQNAKLEKNVKMKNLKKIKRLRLYSSLVKTSSSWGRGWVQLKNGQQLFLLQYFYFF